MPSFQSVLRLLAAAVLVIGFAGCASSSKTTTTTIGPTTAWSQAAVEAIAKELPRATALLSEAVYNQDQETGIPADFGVGQDSARFLNDVQLLHEGAVELAGAVGSGKGLADTIGSYERLEANTADAKSHGAEAFATTPILTHFKNVEYLVGKLKPYYVGGK